MSETPSWEFLLQQDGDSAWLSIDPPTVEILEGRYRIAAKSIHPRRSVEVLIRHDATEEDPPKRRVQKRTYQTNQKGLMVVIPYTELQPGLWEFRCTEQAIAGEGEKTHAIQLQVLPREADALDDWNFDWDDALDEEFSSFSTFSDPEPDLISEPIAASTPELIAEPTLEPIAALAPEPTTVPMPTPEITPPEPSLTTSKEEVPLAGKSVAEILQLATQQSDQLADEVLHEYGLTSDQDESDEVTPTLTPEPLQASPHTPEPLALSIVLDQDTYIVQRGQMLVLSGEIIPDLTQEVPSVLSHAELSVCLRDPQTADILLETHQSLENLTLPSPLTYQMRLPEGLNTQLVLGELILRDRTTEAAEILATQSFTLTADLQDLLDAIRKTKDAEEAPDFSVSQAGQGGASASSKAPVPLNLTFLNFVQAPKTPQGENFVPVAGQILPPQLNAWTSPAVSKRKIDLPNFGDRPSEAPTDTPTQLEIPLPPIEFVTEPPQTEEALAADVEQLEIELMTADASATNSDDLFFDRLNALVGDSTQTEELKALADDVSDSDSDELPEELVALLPPFTAIEIAPNPDPHEGEFVVDDEPILPVADLVLVRQQKAAQSSLDRSHNPLLIPVDQPVPEPSIAVNATELEVGQPVRVTVQLPDVLPKLYVKLWINDRQSRAVLEPPRWIVDFSPNGLGKLEATTELTVPMGSVEVRIEAVTVEVMTNRESHKVSLDRQVLAPELENLLVEDFDV